MLPTSPPKYVSWRDIVAPIKLGEKGWRAFAIQHAVGVEADGHWGPITNQAVKAWQKGAGLTVDGVAGPITQGAMLSQMADWADAQQSLQKGISYGFCVAEGGGVLAATNWSVPGGVDCGPAQWRCLEPFKRPDLERAFNPWRALDDAAERLRLAVNAMRTRQRWPVNGYRLIDVAVLQHNWPVGAEDICRTGEVSRPNDAALWAPKPDGGFYTRREWCHEYPRRILQFVD